MKVGVGKEIRVGRLKVRTFSLLISIIIHLGFLGAFLFLFPPDSPQHVKRIEIDYIISLPMGDHDPRESSGKPLVSSLTFVPGRKNEDSLKPFLILAKKSSMSSTLRLQGRMLSLKETSNSGQRESRLVFSSPTKMRLPLRKTDSLREGSSKMIRERVEGNVSIDKTAIFSAFSVPNYYAELATLRDAGVWVSHISHERTHKARVISSSRDPLFPPRRNFAPLPMRRSEKSYRHHQTGTTEKGVRPEITMTGFREVFPYKKVASREPNSPPRISPGRAKENGGGEILSSSLNPMMQAASSGYSRTVREKEFSSLLIEPGFHGEGMRALKAETELLTQDLGLREYTEKIRNLINANKEYPPVARQRGWEGRIKVRFMINSSGTVMKTEISSPCGYQVLNRAAEGLIRDRSPFPPFPFSWRDDPLVLEVLVAYELEESTFAKENES